jgi:hypothetical protein
VLRIKNLLYDIKSHHLYNQQNMDIDIEGDDLNKKNNLKCVKHLYQGEKIMQEELK